MLATSKNQLWRIKNVFDSASTGLLSYISSWGHRRLPFPLRLALQKRILSIGHNSALLRLHNAVIQKAGYHVTTTKEINLMLEIAKKQDFDAAVVCNSIAFSLREQMVRQLKRLKPAMPLIVMCEAAECNAFKKLAEIVIAPPGISQQPLIDAIARVTAGAQRHAERLFEPFLLARQRWRVLCPCLRIMYRYKTGCSHAGSQCSDTLREFLWNVNRNF